MVRKTKKKAESEIFSAEKKVEGEFIKVEKEVKDTIDKLSRVGLHEYATYLSHPGRIFWTNLLAGTARGLGFLLGAAIVLAVFSYLVSVLVDLPYIGEFFLNLNKFLEQSTELYNNSKF